MTDNKDLKYIQTFKKEPNVPKTYEQFILEDQQLTSEQGQNLYPELNHEDISSSRGYGPCTISGCSHPNRCFYLEIGFWEGDNNLLWNKWCFENNGSKFQSLVMNNVEEAREVVRKLKNESYKIKAKTGWDEHEVQKKKEIVISKIRSYIISHERGNSIHEAHLDLSNIDSIENIPEESSEKTSGFLWQRDSDWSKGLSQSHSEEQDKWPWAKDSSSKKFWWDK